MSSQVSHECLKTGKIAAWQMEPHRERQRTKLSKFPSDSCVRLHRHTFVSRALSSSTRVETGKATDRLQVTELPLFAALFIVCAVTKLIRATVRPLLPYVPESAYRLPGGVIEPVEESRQPGPLRRRLDHIAGCLITDVVVICSLIFFWRSFGLLWFMYQLIASLSAFVLLRMGSYVEEYVFFN